MNKPFFAPQLYIPNGIRDVSFYTKAFGAKELRRFSNDDATIHVSELSISGAIFHLHEVTTKPDHFAPDKHRGTTVLLGLFVDDVDQYMASAISAGAVETSPAQDYDYGYRQGQIQDPFGHQWLIQKQI